jgi:hypothetical protein
MTFAELKAAVMELSLADQKRLIMEVVPQLWPKACVDDACLNRVKELVDEETVRKYREEHMNHI